VRERRSNKKEGRKKESEMVRDTSNRP
jgi:hypothetical protein